MNILGRKPGETMVAKGASIQVVNPYNPWSSSKTHQWQPDYVAYNEPTTAGTREGGMQLIPWLLVHNNMINILRSLYTETNYEYSNEICWDDLSIFSIVWNVQKESNRKIRGYKKGFGFPINMAMIEWRVLLNQQLTQKLKLAGEGKFNDTLLTLPLTCGFEILERPNKWKSILIREEITLEGHEHKTFMGNLLLYYFKSPIDPKA